MAERRMISLKVIDTDVFLDMPVSTRYLYHELNARADDDGFLASPKKIAKMIGCSDDDLKILIAKQFVICFQSGIMVIKHWRISNYVQKDRYKPTIYQDERNQLITDKSGEYEIMDTNCIQDVSSSDTQVRLGKDRLELGKDRLELGKDSIDINADKPQKSTRFIPPSVEEVKAYCEERKNGIDPEHFVDYHIAIGWVVGKNKKPMKDWEAVIRTWERNGNNVQNANGADSGNHGTGKSYGLLL